MTLSGSGLSDSGIDRALRLALEKELDKTLASGELFKDERARFPDPVPTVEVRRPWQRKISEKRSAPSAPSVGATMSSAVRRERAADPAASDENKSRTAPGVDAPPAAEYKAALADARREMLPKQRDFAWNPQRTGIVVIHGIGPQLAGQTLLDWTRPIIQVLRDVPRMPDSKLIVPLSKGGTVKDPVIKSNIDFSGETFPVVQVGIPRRSDYGPDDPRGQERTWVFTEAWWASEIRAPSLATMISWLGEQGGVGRIVQGIQENKLTGRWAVIGRISLQPIVSVLTSFVLLLFVLLLTLSKIIPFGPLRDAVVLRLASSFLTDWFGGARTLLRDPSQSANVRYRLLMAIKALRAYGCRDVVIIAHSGGTMVSLTTLTDPAFAGLNVQKLITIGEALNLGWRLNDADPDRPPPTPEPGDRMAADLVRLQPDLQWRDFWGTDDPAPSGSPKLPRTFGDETWPRFTAERVYNRMSLLEDHGGYWDNDEHFVIPLLREIDVPTGDRGASRFYTDADESFVRSRRKERVGLLALWRRALLSLPVVAIVAAATVSAPGYVPTLGALVLQLFGLIPGNEIVAQAANAFVDWIASISTQNVPLIPAFLRFDSLLTPLYLLGTWVLEAILIALLVFSVLPGQIDRLFVNQERGARPRFILLVIDYAVGIGAFAMVIAGFVFLLTPERRAAIWEGLSAGPFVLLVGGGVFAWGVGRAGKAARGFLRGTDQGKNLFGRVMLWLTAHTPVTRGGFLWATRNLGIFGSAAFLGLVLIVTLVMFLSILLVIIDSDNANHQFVIGAIAALVVFNVLGRLGTWRWNVWDVRERRELRRKPTTGPQRSWPYTLGLILTLVGFAATSIVALGAEGTSTWLGVTRDTWLVATVLTIVAIVLFSLAKDIVDNDIDTETSTPGDGSGGAPAVLPDQPAKSAGS